MIVRAWVDGIYKDIEIEEENSYFPSYEEEQITEEGE